MLSTWLSCVFGMRSTEASWKIGVGELWSKAAHCPSLAVERPTVPAGSRSRLVVLHIVSFYLILKILVCCLGCVKEPLKGKNWLCIKASCVCVCGGSTFVCFALRDVLFSLFLLLIIVFVWSWTV